MSKPKSETSSLRKASQKGFRTRIDTAQTSLGLSGHLRLFSKNSVTAQLSVTETQEASRAHARSFIVMLAAGLLTPAILFSGACHGEANVAPLSPESATDPIGARSAKDGSYDGGYDSALDAPTGNVGATTNAEAGHLSTFDAEPDGPMPGLPTAEKGSAVRVARRGPPSSTAERAKLEYFGGRVIEHAKVSIVFWGPRVNRETTNKIYAFYEAVLKGKYMDWLSEYNTQFPGGTNQSIGRGSVEGAHTIVPHFSAVTLTDADVQAELKSQINEGSLPLPDNQTIYAVYLPPGVTVELGRDHSCVVGGFCAYHGTFRHTEGQTMTEGYYNLMPDFGPGGGCDLGCGSGSAFEKLTTAASHELIETVTDPGVGLEELSWYDPHSGEISDICLGQQYPFEGYTVQAQWSNSRSICYEPVNCHPTCSDSLGALCGADSCGGVCLCPGGLHCGNGRCKTSLDETGEGMCRGVVCSCCKGDPFCANSTTECTKACRERGCRD